MTARPELGATLHHVCVRSPDPARAARFYAAAYALACTALGDGFRCVAPERTLVVMPGAAGTIGWFAYAFVERAELARHRRVVEARNLALVANPSPLLDDDAFGVTDPSGNVVVFGVARSAAPVPAEPLAARLQHCAFRTPDVARAAAFYASLGFVVSDRVVDDDGVLRACFLRTDHEHHALALFAAPAARLDHLSCETRDLASLVAWADRTAAQGVPIHWGIGRHGPGNDVFFMVKDPDDNLIEISAELETCAAERPAGQWRHEPRTLNLWGTAIMRS
jgi:catechol 2,3-dioxygenase-like lactoylglutathione lyase family enzyme